MEIGTEISKKIRAAIKGKLQELGAYIDEELPDYIMVMVANKKTSQQMADDLSLFLGNNTIKFTTWLNGVLEKLRSVAVEPSSLRHQLQSDSSTMSTKSRLSAGEDGRTDELRALAVSSSRSDRSDASVSSSAHESRRGSMEKGSSRLTSTVKPLMELLPSEAVIDIKPEMDDDLMAEDPMVIGTNGGRSRGAASRDRPPLVRVDTYRPSEGGSHSRQSLRSSRSSSTKEDLSRKRKAPVASSVVRVSRAVDEDSDDADDDDTSYGGRGLSSRVSLPSKPERKPSLPPAKQANRNLILKAISEAQDSITKTTTYPPPQRQTVPVAPRTRLASSEEMTAAIQLVQEHLHSLAPRAQAYPSAELPPRRALESGSNCGHTDEAFSSKNHDHHQQTPARSLASRLQLDLAERNDRQEQGEYSMEVATNRETKTFDTRSFIMSRPQVDESETRAQQRLPHKDEVLAALPRTVQASKDRDDSCSPKFIVTLDGVPSPMGNFAECDMELDDVRPPSKVTKGSIHFNRESKTSVHQRLQGEVQPSEDDMMDPEMEEDDDDLPLKKQRLLSQRCKFWPACKSGDECPYEHPALQDQAVSPKAQRCKFWPACKSGDECPYHHPTTQCKTFPRCKFGDKCLFIHPNCKYDAKCTKPDCPFTHVSRRSTAAPPPRIAAPAAQTPTVCHFFPECKKMDCPFYHPKPCRFAGQCKRAGCTFYHPTTSVPPRQALKWTKAQSS